MSPELPQTGAIIAKIHYDHDQLTNDELKGRLYRITVPLSDISDETFGGLPNRIDIGAKAFLVRLDSHESERLTEANLPDDERDHRSICHRIEILDVPVHEAYEQWALLEAQCMLVLRRPLPVVAAVLDREVEGVWRRGGMLDIDQHQIWTNDTPVERLSTLKSLRDGMDRSVHATVRRSANLYVQSVRSLSRGELDNSFILAAMSLETLLGHEVRGENTYRIALRSTILEGNSSDAVLKRIKDLYKTRSRLVHAGRSVSYTDVTHIQQALMRFIPTIAALAQKTHGYEGAINHLDQLAWDRSTDPGYILAGNGWWNYVPLEECFKRSYGRFDSTAHERHIFIFDY